MDFFKFRQNLTVYTDLAVIQHLQCQSQLFVSYLLPEDPGPSIPNIAAILPDFDGFLPILSKLNYLYRYNCHPTLQYQNLPFVSHLLAEDQGRPIPVQRQYCQFSMYFFQFNQNSTIYTDLNVIRPYNARIYPLSPTCLLRTKGGRSQCSGNIASFRCISSNLIKTRLFIQT